MKTKKIMLSGRGGAGKDVFADYLVEKYRFKKITFADGVYDIAYRYFNMTEKDRWLLQNIGEKMREIDPYVWINTAFKDIEKYERVVISDCRKIEEYMEGSKRGFVPVRIKADLDVRIKRIETRDGACPNLTLLENEIESETDSLSYIEIENNGSLEDLYGEIENIVEENWEDTLEKFEAHYVDVGMLFKE